MTHAQMASNLICTEIVPWCKRIGIRIDACSIKGGAIGRLVADIRDGVLTYKDARLHLQLLMIIHSTIKIDKTLHKPEEKT